MEIMGFTIEELSQLEDLLQISTNVNKIMDCLCKLEVNGQKDRKEYQQQLLELTRTINIENEKYQKLNLTYQQCYKYAKFLSIQANEPLFDTKPTTIIKNNNNKVIKRVINNLITIMMLNKNFHQSIIPQNIINQITKIENEITAEQFLASFEHNVKIQTTLNTDIYCIFLSILEETISQKSYKEYRTELVKAKYCISTSHKELELFLLHCKFSIPKEIYTSTKLTTELLKETNKSYDIIRFTELKTKAQIEINKLIQITDSDYSNTTIYINSIISSCYLRALLSLMKDNEINNFKQEFQAQIDSHEYMIKHLNDRISENIIMNCFKCFKYDREKIRILSTKN